MSSIFMREDARHQVLPLSQATPEAKLAGCLPAQAGGHLVSLAALGVRYVPILPPGNENVTRQRIRF
jgi:hypothetical protein